MQALRQNCSRKSKQDCKRDSIRSETRNSATWRIWSLIKHIPCSSGDCYKFVACHSVDSACGSHSYITIFFWVRSRRLTDSPNRNSCQCGSDSLFSFGTASDCSTARPCKCLSVHTHKWLMNSWQTISSINTQLWITSTLKMPTVVVADALCNLLASAGSWC